uniref:F-BAR domain only protein 2 n=1 Tax=Ditylenchus dipsaci TaxID=166011 RepID=A0A915EGG6_9BILA
MICKPGRNDSAQIFFLKRTTVSGTQVIMLLQYGEHFWGEKHIGYHVLYENLKKGEDTVHELGTFVKERISMEDDMLKSLNKSINRVGNFVSFNGAFTETWRVTKGTLELWSEIQTSVLKNLTELSKEIIKYHDDLVKSRKRVKEYDVLDAVNLMQTTTTCLQKAKETYTQRCAEVANLKCELGNTKESAKEFLKAKNKLIKAHEEYKTYVEKYNQVRDTFEDKMLKATSAFQAHDHAHLLQIQKFFGHLARSLDDSHSAISQVTTDFRQNLERFNVENVMFRFVEERGTGRERPQPIKWTEADELPADLDGLPALSAAGSQPSSSNSSAVISCPNPIENVPPTVNDLLGIDETWTTSVHNPHGSDSKSGDSDSESGLGTANLPVPANSAAAHSSYVPQFSSWLGRQRITQWRKKHSASQSNLPTSTSDNTTDFSASYNDGGASNAGDNTSLGYKSNFLRRYRKSKNSINDLTQMSENKDYLQTEDNRSTTSSSKSDEKTPVNFANSFGTSSLSGVDPFASLMLGLGPPPPIPSSEPPPLAERPISSSIGNGFVPSLQSKVDAEGFTIPSSLLEASNTKLEKDWTSYTSSSEDDDETEFQTSKIKALQIKPINESEPKINASVDELRSAIGHISLQRSSTFDKDPWSSSTTDEKFSEVDYSMPSPNFDFSQSVSGSSFGAGTGIARARPRSHTPNAQLMQSNSSSTIAASSNNMLNSQEKAANVKTEQKHKISAASICFNNGKEFMGSLSNLTGISLNSDSVFAGPSSSSPLTLSSSNIVQPTSNKQQKLHIALAVNEYVHALFKGEDMSKVIVRVFGTVMISLPMSILPRLLDEATDIRPLKFSLKNAHEIKDISPNKKLLQSICSCEPPSETYSFLIERKTLTNWLSEQQKMKPDNTFHNVDLVRYTLTDGYSPPLFFTAYWKTEVGQTDLRIDYKLNTNQDTTAHNTLLNIIFSTSISGKMLSFNSVPEAKWNEENSTLNWTLTELSKHESAMGP